MVGIAVLDWFVRERWFRRWRTAVIANGAKPSSAASEAQLEHWSEDQLARAWLSGFLTRFPPEFWDDLAEAWASPGEEE